MEKETSWYVKITKENQEVVTEWMKGKPNLSLLSIGCVCGVSKKIRKFYNHTPISDLDGEVYAEKEITTQEFYEKIGHKPDKEHIEPWSKNTYVVFTHGNWGAYAGTQHQLKIGEVRKIEASNNEVRSISVGHKFWVDKQYCKWFATKEEAEDYSKILLNQETPKETTKFKVGDWVIGWHYYHEEFSSKPWRIGKILKHNSLNYYVPKGYNGYNTEESKIKLVTETELKEFTKHKQKEENNGRSKIDDTLESLTRRPRRSRVENSSIEIKAIFKEGYSDTGREVNRSRRKATREN